MPQIYDMDRRLYFSSEGRHAENFFALKIRRLRPGLNPRTTEAAMKGRCKINEVPDIVTFLWHLVSPIMALAHEPKHVATKP